MGNLVTKLTTNNIELDESNVSDIGVVEQVKKEKSPTASGQMRTGLFKSIWNYDPRSPSTFISRTPIAMFRNSSAGRFQHQELNESIESQVSMEILTPEEQNSLDSNTDLASIKEDDNLPDPRSPITEIVRTPIIAIGEPSKKKEDNLMKKLTDKLISTAISNDDGMATEEKAAVKKVEQKKNLIYEDDEDCYDIYSTPPKKIVKEIPLSRTPLSCVANTNTPKSRSFIPTSTPKSKIPINDENVKSASRIPVSSRRLQKLE